MVLIRNANSAVIFSGQSNIVDTGASPPAAPPVNENAIVDVANTPVAFSDQKRVFINVTGNLVTTG